MTKTTIFKKVISILLAMTIIAGFLPVGVIEVGAVTPSAKSLPDISGMSQVDAFIAIAKSQEGYVEGYNNDTIYGIFTGKNNQAWCGSFVAWCANKAGISESIIPQSLTSSVNPASSNSMIKWYDKKGQWYKTRGGSWDNEIYDQPEKSVDYAPKSGDLILFETDNAFGNGPDHIGIFWKNENGKIYTIEGNTGTNKNSVKIKEYENDNTIWGYCHPNWSDGGSSSTPTVPTLGDPVSVGDNFYAYIRGVDNKNLTIDGASTPNVILTPSSNKKQDGKEIWYFKKGGDGYYYIKNVATGGYLDVYTGKPGPNLNVVLWGTERNENDAATHWYIHKHNGKYVLRAQCSYSDVVLDIHRDWGDMAGTYEFHGEANQLFTINKIDLSTYKPQNVTVSYNKNDASATVSWTANEKVDSQVSYYDIQIIRVSDNKVVKSKKNLTSRSYTFAELEDGEYYAKVIGRNKADPSNLKGIKDSSHFTAKRTVINVEKPTFTVFQKDKAYTAKFVTIASKTSGSTIYYTTDGSSPSTTSKKLKNGGTIKVSSNCTVKAIAVKSGFKSGTASRYVYAGMKFGDADGNGKVNDDDTAMFVYDKFCIYNADVNGDGKANLTDFSNLSSGEMPVKNAPTITHEKVTGGYKLTFETKAKASTLYYSTDGGNNYNTIKNGGSVTVKSSCTVKAYSKIYGVKSSTASKKITITKKKVETPEMTVTSVYNGKQVKLTCKTSGATIYYTTDGSKPTSSSKKYTGVFSVKASQTIKAIAIKSGMTNSSVISKSITVNKLNAPTADISSGSTVEKGTYLYLSADSGSTIYYTTDGSNPTTSSIKYTGKIKIEKDITIKAIAVRKGYLNSDIKTYNYKINNQTENLTISGYVWLDIPMNKASTRDNRKYEGKEDGINGLIVTLTGNGNSYISKTKTLSGIDGSYKFENISAGYYTLSLTYNSIMYTAPVVIDSNNTVLDYYVQNPYDDFIVKSDGTYSGEIKISDSNSQSEAKYDDAFNAEVRTDFECNSDTQINFGIGKYSYITSLATRVNLKKYTIKNGYETIESKNVSTREQIDKIVLTDSGYTVDFEYKVSVKNQNYKTFADLFVIVYIPHYTFNIYVEDGNYVGEYTINGEKYYGYLIQTPTIDDQTVPSYNVSFTILNGDKAYLLAEIAGYRLMLNEIAADVTNENVQYLNTYKPIFNSDVPGNLIDMANSLFYYDQIIGNTEYDEDTVPLISVVSLADLWSEGGIPSSMVGNNDNDSGLSASPAVGIFPFVNQNLYA